jgi:S1-C subfamily serine protease
MKINKVIVFIALFIIVPLMVSQSVNAEMFMTKAAAAVIKSISDINVNLTQNDKFVFPNKVKAQLTNGKTTDTAITWDKKSIATNKIGVYVSYGTVKGYSKKVKLTVNVYAAIKSIDGATINTRQGETTSLPNTISATLTDGTKRSVDVAWSSKIDTSKVGTYVIEGVVKGFKDKVKTIVKVNPKILTVNQIEAKVTLGSNYELPRKVEAILSNNTKDFVEVKWNAKSVDTANVGTIIVEGSIEGYSSKVYLVVNISPKTIQDVAKESSKVLLLYTYDKHGFIISTGSGFIVSEDGKVLTNFHVVDGANKVRAVNDNGEYIDIKGIYTYNKDQDIALLQLDSTKKFPYVQLGDSDKLQQGERIIAIGSPKGFQNTLSEGLVSSFRKDMRSGFADIQISAAISPGSSGGALFNMNGEVVGITYAKINGGENINFAIPINEAKLLMGNTSNLSPISTIEKYDEKIAYAAFENYLQETYDYFWLGDTKIYLDDFDVELSSDGKIMEIYAYISDNKNNYQNYQKVMRDISDIQKNSVKVEVQQWIYKPLKDGKNFFPDKDMYLGLYTVALFDKNPSDPEWDYTVYDKELGKWVCYDTEVLCTEKNDEFIFRWMKNY